MKTKLYNKQGQEVGQVELPDSVFAVAPNHDLMHQAVVTQQANSRQVLAHTKDRSEVRGGGRKPWAQKGTGRARHGSSRSPIWIGGGVTFGPTKDRVFSKSLNKSMKKKALFMALSSKVKDNELVVLDNFEITGGKTKEACLVIQKLGQALKKDFNQSTLVVLPKAEIATIRAIRNIPKVKTIGANSLNIVDVLQYRNLLLLQDAIKVIETNFKI